MTQLALAHALADYDGRLQHTYDKTVGAWERDGTPRLPFYVVVAIADATGQPVEAFAGAVRESRPEPSNGRPADRAKWDAKQPEVAADLAAQRRAKRRQGTDDTTR